MKASEKKTDTWRLWQRIILYLTSAAFSLPNLIYIANGWFVRHRADDFCFSGTFREYGMVKGLSHFYQTISNRFSAFIIWSFSDLFGEKSIRIFSMLAIIFLSAVIFVVLKGVTKRFQWGQGAPLAIMVSQVLTFFILYLSPTIHQSVYWRAAMVHYFLPFPALILLVRYVIMFQPDQPIKFRHSLLFFLATFFLAGLSESYAALQGGAFALLLLVFILDPERKQHRHVFWFSITAIISTVFVFFIMINSPGNALKFSLLEQAPDITTVISVALRSSADFVYYTIRGQWLPFSILFTFGLLMPFLFDRHDDWKANVQNILIYAGFVFFSVVVLIFCVCAPTAYGMTAYPEKRVLMLANMVLVLGVFIEGLLFGFIFRKIIKRKKYQKIAASVLLIIFALYPLLSLPDITSMIKFYQERARLWDLQQTEIKRQIDQGKTNLEVSALDAFAEIAEMRDYDTFWVNICNAQYYNVDTITAVEQ